MSLTLKRFKPNDNPYVDVFINKFERRVVSHYLKHSSPKEDGEYRKMRCQISNALEKSWRKRNAKSN